MLASLVACVGPLAVLGAFADGLRGDLGRLAVNSLLDGFAMLAFASYLLPAVLLAPSPPAWPWRSASVNHGAAAAHH